MPRLILNAVQLSTSSAAKIQIGSIRYDEKLLSDLRRQNVGSHIFRRDHETDKIQCIAVRPDTIPIGEAAAEQELNKTPWLINALALEALTHSGQWDLYWQTQFRPTG